MTKTVTLDDSPDNQEREESMTNETIEAEATEVAGPSPEERLKELKAMAYDHLSTIEKLQADLRQINEAIRVTKEKIDEAEEA